MSANHKESPFIKQWLAHAIGVAWESITNFRTEGLGVREKLGLASTHDAIKEGGIAYFLIGIFAGDIVPRCRLEETTLGHPLENIVARSGDSVTVIAWTGKLLLYNSSHPDSLAVYSQTPYPRRPDGFVSNDESKVESESDLGSCDGIDHDASAPASPLQSL